MPSAFRNLAELISIYRAGCQSEWGILSRQPSCPEATVRNILDIAGSAFVCRQDGATALRPRDTVAFLERKVLDFIPQTLWPPHSPDLNSVDYSICSVLQDSLPIQNC